MIQRAGGTFGVYLAAGLHLLRRRFISRDIDLVIDCANGIPFFSPLFVPGVPVVCVMHHVHQDQFREHFGPVLAFGGRLSEGFLSRLVYRRAVFAAVSASTRDGIVERLRIQRPIVVAPNGLRAPAPAISAPGRRSVLVCVARLVPHKRVDLLLEALAQLMSRGQPLTLAIVGDGPERERLEALVSELGLVGLVTFLGHLPEAAKNAHLASAALHVVPSSREGWGLAVIEAASLGVPSVGYRVAGVSDAIIDGTTGWLASPQGSSVALADRIEEALAVLSDPIAASAFAKAAREWASLFTWERTVERLAVAASLAQESSSRIECVPVVLAPTRPYGPSSGDEVQECAHGTLILTWASGAAEVHQRAGEGEGQVRGATAVELHTGPRCSRCVGEPT